MKKRTKREKFLFITLMIVMFGGFLYYLLRPQTQTFVSTNNNNTEQVYFKTKKGFETVGKPESYDLPNPPNIWSEGFEIDMLMSLPKGYQIIENEHGVFLYVYIGDTFNDNHITKFRKTKEGEQIRIYLQTEGFDSTYGMKISYYKIFGVYKLKNKVDSPIVEYYNVKEKEWIKLQEIDYIAMWEKIKQNPKKK